MNDNFINIENVETLIIAEKVLRIDNLAKCLVLIFRNPTLWSSQMIISVLIFISREKGLFESQSEIENGLKTDSFWHRVNGSFTAVVRWIDILLLVFYWNWYFFFFRWNIEMNSEPKWFKIECMLNGCLNIECTSCFILINNVICYYIFIVLHDQDLN